MPDSARQAEAALLSAVLSYEDLVVLASECLRPHHFSDPAHRRIFEAALEVDRCGIPVDVTTVGQQLGSGNGILSTMTELLSVPSTSASVPHYARIIIDNSVKRAVGTVTKGLADMGSGSEMLAELNRRVREIERSAAIGDDDSALLSPDSLRALRSRLTDLGKDEKRVFPTGIDLLDGVVGGLQVGTVTALQGLFKTGKTRMLIAILVHLAKSGVPVGLFSLDMTAERIRDWIVSHVSRVDSRFFKDPSHKRWDVYLPGGERLRDDYVSRIERAESTLSSLPIHITDKRRPTVDEVGAITARWARKGVQVVAIDYLERLSNFIGDWNLEGQITSRLADIAARHNVALVYVDQVNRSAERDDKTTLMHSRGSVARLADADTLLQLRNVSSRDRKSEADNMADLEMLIVQRDGVSGKRIKLRGDMSTGHFAGREN